MDVLKILKENRDEILYSELEMLEVALHTGEYTEAQISEAESILNQLRNELSPKKTEAPAETPLVQPVPPMPNPANPPDQLTLIKKQLSILRLTDNSKQAFRKFVQTTPAIDVAFLAGHLDIFQDYELDELLSFRQLGENLLEQYWSILNKTVIAKCQLFSEDFFIKHFADLPATAVLKNGVNPWRKKKDRSPKLTMFLKLKGVTI